MTDTGANYTSGEEYVVEFLGFSFKFNACDFEQRVIAAAVKLGLVEANELDEEETRDLVTLAAQGADRGSGVAARPLPRCATGSASRSSAASRSSTGCASSSSAAPGSTTRSSAARSRSSGTTSRPSSRTSTRAAAGHSSSWRRCRHGTSCSTAA